MNLAFPAALLFAFLLPGFILRTAFQKPERSVPDVTPFAWTISTSVFLALLLNALWCYAAETLTPWRVDWEALLLMVSADRGSAYEAAIQRAAHWPQGPLLYLASLCGAAYLCGSLLRSLIQWLRLDREDLPISSWLRADTPWYYLFSGYDAQPQPDAVLICAVVQIGAQAYLYVGRLVEYFLTRDGQIDRLVLEDVWRRPMAADRPEVPEAHADAATSEERFYRIDGDYFVLHAAEIRTLNIRYLRLSVGDAVRD